jgi:hypothetical protein
VTAEVTDALDAAVEAVETGAEEVETADSELDIVTEEIQSAAAGIDEVSIAVQQGADAATRVASVTEETADAARRSRTPSARFTTSAPIRPTCSPRSMMCCRRPARAERRDSGRPKRSQPGWMSSTATVGSRRARGR